MPLIQDTVCKCARCGRKWVPVEWGHLKGAGQPPRTCPECKSPNWDKEEVAPVGRPKKTEAAIRELTTEYDPQE